MGGKNILGNLCSEKNGFCVFCVFYGGVNIQILVFVSIIIFILFCKSNVLRYIIFFSTQN